jgi:hypothetical protein
MQKKLAFIFHFRVPVSSRKKCAELRKNERNARFPNVTLSHKFLKRKRAMPNLFMFSNSKFIYFL